MKNLLSILLILAAGAAYAEDRVLIVNSTNPAQRKVSGIVVTSNQIPSSAVAGVKTSAGAGSSNQVVLLNNSGLVDSTMLPAASASSLISTNIATATASASAGAWMAICQLTTTATNGSVQVSGRAVIATIQGAQNYLRLRDTSTNVVSQVTFNSATAPLAMQVQMFDTLSGAAKTYVLEATANAGSTVYTNSAATPFMTNALGMTILQIP